MKYPRPLSASFALLFLFAIGALMPQSHAAEKKKLSEESFGKLVLGGKAKDLLTLLGKPEVIGTETRWEAIGQWVQEWRFPTRGLTINMASDQKNGQKHILNITATAAGKLTTARGIGIGSTEAEVRKAYQDVQDKSASEPGALFVAGSVYDGILFTIKEGKVARIFLGAAAE